MTRSPEIIRSKQNKRLQRLQRLFHRKHRRKAGQTVLVGEKILRDALSDELTISQVFTSEELSPELAQELARQRVLTLPVKASLLRQVVPLDHPPGLVAIASIPDQRWPQCSADRASALVVGCGLQDPGNLGTILRTAWFFGFRGGLLLPGSTDPWSPKVLRAAIAAVLRCPVEQAESLNGAIQRVADQGYTPVLLDSNGGEDLAPGVLPKRAAFFLGEEGQGFERWQQDQDPNDSASLGPVTRICIRGQGQAESLNVAMAFGMAAYQWFQDWGP